MSIKSGASQYRNTFIKTANRGQLLILLYEGAIQHLKKAMLAIEEGDRAKKGVHIGKAHDIVNELAITLDFEVGGELARNLEGLYNFVITQMIKANSENIKEPLEASIKILLNLLEAWRVAVVEVNKAEAKKNETNSAAHLGGEGNLKT